MSLEGRVALVTGGGRGIGQAISLGLAEDGANIAINYRRDAQAALETVKQIEALGRKARAYSASVDRFDEDETMVKQILADFGHVDILINNAGQASRGKSVAKTDPEELQRVVHTHALAPHYLSKLVLPSMRERARGDIIMISSNATRLMAGGGAPYNMGKAAMEALAFTLSKEELRNNIHVNIVAPGLVETEMGRRLIQAIRGDGDLRKLDPSMPFRHVCTPREIASVVRFLVSDAAGYVTGQRIYVDGGGLGGLG
ncbi:MAG: SDR family oxidoreductase [Deltaproteobacteria bacterium]|nr:MAG: SDR family oxidoreductase [Deltaproteobacteria bacterium]